MSISKYFNWSFSNHVDRVNVWCTLFWSSHNMNPDVLSVKVTCSEVSLPLLCYAFHTILIYFLFSFLTFWFPSSFLFILSPWVSSSYHSAALPGASSLVWSSGTGVSWCGLFSDESVFNVDLICDVVNRRLIRWCMKQTWSKPQLKNNWRRH